MKISCDCFPPSTHSDQGNEDSAHPSATEQGTTQEPPNFKNQALSELDPSILTEQHSEDSAHSENQPEAENQLLDYSSESDDFCLQDVLAYAVEYLDFYETPCY